MPGTIKLKKDKNDDNEKNIQKQEIRKDLSKPTVYTDSAFIRTNKFGLVLDFAQILSQSDHNIVASVGMSYEHGKALLDLLKRHLEKEEE
ncbi:hypothetical protein GF362_04810 [Candidatus Dojkabacteria bacterium]|nr:hypothetical protein [Candidatus Dojkabacteria bacterium]